jgi:hypothetical protein
MCASVALEAGRSDQAVAPRLVPGRSCGSCSLCCKVVGVDELAKPIGAWCRHCNRQNGCAIYDTRPASCRMFICQWMLAENLGPEWKPDRAKFALLKSAGGRHLTVFADPGNPSAWRRSPYYENLKHWAAQGVRNSADLHLVDVMIGSRCIVILPDREVDIGDLGPGEMIHLECRPTAASPVIEAFKVKPASAAA